MKMRYLVVLIFLVLTALPALAVNPDEVLSDPALEARARLISAKLRCLVCQNQSIDDSDAELARDLRLIVRERLSAGDSNEQTIDYLVARYGEFVLLQPRFSGHTALLWLSPFAIFLFAAGGVLFWRRNQARIAPLPPLSTEEEAALRDILDRK